MSTEDRGLPQAGDRLVSGPAARSETEELGHERNEVAKAQKEAASQETAGVMDPRD